MQGTPELSPPGRGQRLASSSENNRTERGLPPAHVEMVFEPARARGSKASH